MEESRGIASSPATGMADEPEEITREAVRNPGDDYLVSILDGQQPDPKARSKHRISKAPAKFREYEMGKKYFDPQVVSLGPYHCRKYHLKPMEKHKITAAKQFFDQFTNETGGRGGIYKKFKELTGDLDLKECYDGVANMNDDDFARMMFLDGCFVLHFIEEINEGGKTKSEIRDYLIPLIIRDMFLIENQLPFQVLDALMKLRWGSSSLGKQTISQMISKFIEWEVLSPMGFRPGNYSWLSHWCGALDDGEHDSPLHLLDILRAILLNSPPSNREEIHRYRPRYLGSVMELQEIGIRFENRRMKSSMGISYKEDVLFPKLLIPKMFINDTTISQLLNLTAFEMCSDIHSGCGVTSYICFLRSLINLGEDVKELRSKGILYHALGSDDKVALLFKKWPAEVRNDLKLYSDIRMQIIRHRDRPVNISIVTWFNKYFKGPWDALYFVATVLALVFAAIQTFSAAFPRR